MADGIHPLTEGFAPATEADWRALVGRALKDAPFDTLQSRTEDGITVQPLYGKGAAPAIAGRAAIPWQIVQRVDHPDPGAANAQALVDLENGATALCLNFRDGPASHGHGLPTDKTAILAALEGVHVDMIDIRMEPHPKARTTVDALAAALANLGHDPKDTRIRFGLDPVGNLARWGVMADVATVAARLPGTIAGLRDTGFCGPFAEADGRAYHNAGATAGEELAAMIATAVAYLRMGTAPDQIGFTLAVNADQFESIAKIRALRLLWARVLEAAGLPASPAAIHAETSWRMMTQLDPHTNMLRTTIAAFAAGVGGADSVAVLPFSAAFGLPDAFARRIARNTQLVLLEESNLWRVADPVAGSGAAETLTADLAAAAWAGFQTIEREGGVVESLSAGHIQRRIKTARIARQQALENKDRVLVGTTVYRSDPSSEPAILDVPQRPQPVFRTHEVNSAPLPPVRTAEPFETAS